MMQVVWYKRDLRVTHHRPLAEAARRGPVLPLYIAESSVMQAPDFSAGHWAFIRQSLEALRARLAALGQPLVVRRGEAVPTLQRLCEAAGPFALWAHEETGNGITFDRDKAVRAWAHERGLPFHEIPQSGVVRGLTDRDRWSDLWEERMRQPLAAPPDALAPLPRVRPGAIPDAGGDLDLRGDVPAQMQPGGEAEAHRVLDSFLTERGEGYRTEMSSPVTAFDSCSRLSPHLAWGTISVRQVLAAVRARKRAVQRLLPERRGGWAKSLASFESRLRWHDHFTQKLEREPRLEHESYIPAFDDLRPWDEDARERYAAWAAGATGYPLIDACQRALRATGYLNFRMRAMLTSFAAYDLWLPWQHFGHVLARRWIDYVPGIHYPQLQMQSGTTGINTMRVYNPTKQAREQDPGGTFIRRWVPELAGVPDAFVHTPWLMPRAAQEAAGCRIGTNYPAPLVRHVQAARQAKARITAVRKRPEVQAQAEGVIERHASRRRPHRTRRARLPGTEKAAGGGEQQRLDL